MPRALSIGDVHGNLPALEQLLDFVKPAARDQLVFHGDLVDRGPDSSGVVELVRRLVLKGAICLRGNHEHMMRGARFSLPLWNLWVANNGAATLASYGAPDDQSTFAAWIPEEHWDFLDRLCRDWFEMREFILVHAGALPDLPMERQPGQALHWLRLHELQPHRSGKRIVCGHTPQPGGTITVLPHAICIDSGCSVLPDAGCLSCVDLINGHFWQADENGPRSQGSLRSGGQDRPRRQASRPSRGRPGRAAARH